MTRPWPQPQLSRLLRRHQQHRRRAIANLAAVARSDDAIGLERRLERGQLLQRRIAADALVAGEARAVGQRDSHDLAVEVAVIGRRRRQLMAVQAKGVKLLAGDFPLRGDHLGGKPLMRQRIHLQQRRRERMAARGDGRADGQARHALDARANGDVADTRGDQIGGEVDGLLAGATLAIHRRRGYLDGEARLQDGVARDVETLLADLADTAHHHVFDQRRINLCPLHQLAQRHRRQHHRMHIFERAIAPTNRRAHRLDNYDLTHGSIASISVIFRREQRSTTTFHRPR